MRHWRLPGYRSDAAGWKLMVRVSHLGRIGISTICPVLVVVYLARIGIFQQPASGWPLFSVLAVVGFLAFTWALEGVWWLRGGWFSCALGPPLFIALGGITDILWLIGGMLSTGVYGVAFAPLIILTIGLNGVLLPALGTGFVTFIAGIGMGTALAWTNVTHQDIANAPAGIMAVLFVGIGVLAAYLGNRLRAAAVTIEQLNQAVLDTSNASGGVLQALPLGVIVVDSARAPQQANAQALALTETTDTLEAWRVLNAAVPQIAAALTSGESEGGSGEIGERFVSWEVRPLLVPDPTQLPTSVWLPAKRTLVAAVRAQSIVLLNDRTAEKRSREHAALVQHFREVASLSGALAHEVRNPLAAARAAIEQIAEPDLADDLRARMVHVATEQISRASRVVEAFLGYARTGTSHIQTVRLDRYLRDIADAERLGTNGLARLKIDAPPIGARFEAEEVARAIANLVRNAYEATGPEDVIELRGAVSGSTLTVTVSDTGPGVQEKEVARLFEPFTTSRQGGTGLGLAVVARIATMVGGTIRHEPLERGARFILTLPIGEMA